MTVTLYLDDALSALAANLERVEMDRKPRAAVIFNLSRLQPQHRSTEHLQIAVQILRDKMQGADGQIYTMPANDLVLICAATSEQLDAAIFELRYLFAEDPVAYRYDIANPEFCNHFNLPAQTATLRQHCSIRFGLTPNLITSPPANDEKNRLLPLLSEAIETALARLDLSKFQKIQPIYLVTNDKVVLQELNIDLDALQQSLSLHLDLATNHNLFGFIREAIDMHMLKKMVELLQTRNTHSHHFMLPLSMATLYSQEFMLFDAALPEALRRNMVLELHIGDVYRDINSFIELRNNLSERGYYLCLAGLNLKNIFYIDRQQLHCDLIKLAMPSLHVGDNGWFAEELIVKVQSIGASHIIASSCYHETAHRLVKKLGIGMYQS